MKLKPENEDNSGAIAMGGQVVYYKKLRVGNKSGEAALIKETPNNLKD